ncbi:membrane integrity-associated transporter subunit PqiC [candidate division KSB1 bacterium]|nr:membrane integrity-associated transporter subunit PqiC [candidate division KSB1 bacterium]
MKRLFLIVMLFLVSCGSVPETRYFTIDYDFTTHGSTDSKGVLFIKKFKSDPIYFQDKLIYKTSRYEIKFDNYRRWALAPSDLLTYKAAEHLRQAGLFKWITLITPRDKECLTLGGTLKNFEEFVENGKRAAKVTILFELEKNQDKGFLWVKEISSTVPINNPGSEGIIQSMSTATQKVFDELAENLKNLDQPL